MNKTLTRRLALLSAAAGLALGAAGPVGAQTAAAPTSAVERDGAGQTLQDLYQAALKEGGTLTPLPRSCT